MLDIERILARGTFGVDGLSVHYDLDGIEWRLRSNSSLNRHFARCVELNFITRSLAAHFQIGHRPSGGKRSAFTKAFQPSGVIKLRADLNIYAAASRDVMIGDVREGVSPRRDRNTKTAVQQPVPHLR